MTFFLHLRRNITRNQGRTLGLILVVGLTLGIFLVLGQVSASISAYSGQVVASVPNIITVQTSGDFNSGGYFRITFGQGATTGLNNTVMNSISKTANVAAVQRVYTQPLQPSSGSNGGSGSFACGTASNPGVLAEDTTSPIKLIISASGASVITIAQGRNLIPSDENGTVAVVSQQYASANNLIVGSSISIDGKEFSIVGIFSQTCYTIILPYPADVSAMGVTDASIFYVYVNQYVNMNSVLSSLQGQLGSSFNIQILANADRNALQSGISSILFGSQFGQYATLVSGAAVMVVVTMLVMSRRTKEIGLLKTLGYSNGRILGQILSEALIIALLGLPLALLVSLVAGPAIAQSLLGNIGQLNPLGSSTPPGAVRGGSGGNPLLQHVQFAVTPEVLVLGITITISFGLLGAFYPAIKALLLRPTEALRSE
ncbi:MAG TPA: ABC transporter permease [Nitrososphaerales archaeon]|nr:ABC transporter permease [Nitrososphaerales archaeon]